MGNYKSLRPWDAIITKLADESITSDSTMSDDAELKTLLSVGTWYFEVVCLFDSSATPDIKFTMSFAGTSDTSLGWNAYNGNAGNKVWDAAVSSTASVWPIIIKLNGFAVVSVAGILSVGWAQNTSDGGATKMLKGSMLLVRKIA